MVSAIRKQNLLVDHCRLRPEMQLVAHFNAHPGTDRSYHATYWQSRSVPSCTWHRWECRGYRLELVVYLRCPAYLKLVS
jgi:hypothetical protein